jgi:hypothetical protein
MISKGSSGSYFARMKVDGRVKTVAYVTRVLYLIILLSPDLVLTGSVFKPKDEEPYGAMNPKVNFPTFESCRDILSSCVL